MSWEMWALVGGSCLLITSATAEGIWTWLDTRKMRKAKK